MLTSRVILENYRRARSAELRAFLLRELTNPHIHTEPEAVRRNLRKVARPFPQELPVRLTTEATLFEQQVRVRLTTGDAARATGGMWTQLARPRAGAVSGSPVTGPQLVRRAGELLGPIALEILRNVEEPDASEQILVALGELGDEVASAPLMEHLGRHAPAAAAGLTRLRSEAAGRLVFEMVQKQGLNSAGTWLGVALAGLPSADTAPLLRRLIRSGDPNHHLQAAIALENYEDFGAVEHFAELASASPYVRLHALQSISRLSVPVPLETIRALSHRGDAPLLRVTALHAARSAGDSARDFFQDALKTGQAEEKAAALEGLVGLGFDAEILQVAREAAQSVEGPYALVALLALSIGAPDEALHRAIEIFKTKSAAHWHVASYMLRYLHTTQTGTVLMRVCQAVKGTEIELLAVNSLSRHLHRPLVLDFLLSRVNPETAPELASQILEDLARHLPPTEGKLAAQALREKIRACGSQMPIRASLMALGALGTKEDLPFLVSHLKGPSATDAIRGIELLMAPEAEPHLLRAASEGAPEVRCAAMVALFRLGHTSALQQLSTLVQSRDASATACAARAVAHMAMSVCHVTAIPRLNLLRQLLEERARAVAPSETEDQRLVTLHGSLSGMRGALDLTGQTMKIKVLPELRLEPPAIPPSGVYRDLGRHLEGLGMVKGEGGKHLLAAGAAALVVLVLVIHGMLHSTVGTVQSHSPRRVTRHTPPPRAVSPSVAPAATIAVASPTPTTSHVKTSVAGRLSPGDDVDVDGEIISVRESEIIIKGTDRIYVVEKSDSEPQKVGEQYHRRRTVDKVDQMGWVHTRNH